MPSKLDRTHELYAVYANMKGRCYNRNNPYYLEYGAKGIKVCDRWTERVTGFVNFVADMGTRPRGHSLVLIPGTRLYSPQNCLWRNAGSNTFNRHIRSDNRSGVRGVYFNERRQEYQATITIEKKRHHLGWYKNKTDAVQARQLAEQEAAL